MEDVSTNETPDGFEKEMEAGTVSKHETTQLHSVHPKPKGFFRDSDGCIKALAKCHADYLGGVMSADDCCLLDNHLLHCRRCENHWAALTSAMEDEFPYTIEGTAPIDRLKKLPAECKHPEEEKKDRGSPKRTPSPKSVTFPDKCGESQNRKDKTMHHHNEDPGATVPTAVLADENIPEIARHIARFEHEHGLEGLARTNKRFDLGGGRFVEHVAFGNGSVVPAEVGLLFFHVGANKAVVSKVHEFDGLVNNNV